MSDKPLLFISHKHVDHELAKVLADFIKNRTGAQVRIHVSSDPDYVGPPAGRVLNKELCQTLRQTEALILIYTSSDQSWEYCLWECGVATNAATPETNIIVLQCGKEPPPVYDGLLNVRATDLKSVRRFVDTMFRQPGFFPDRPQPLTGFNEKDCEEAATELHAKLVAVLGRQQRPESWSPWPSLRVELPDESLVTLRAAEDRDQIRSIVSEKGVIASYQPGTPKIFGLARIEPETSVAALVGGIGKTADWFESCCYQIADCAANRDPVVRLASLSSAPGEAEYTPVVTNMRRVYGKQKAEFEVCFYNLSDPRGTPVTAKMVAAQKMFSRDLTAVRTQSLGQLIDELEEANIHRLPLLSGGIAQFVVHRSMMEQFLNKRLRAKPPVPETSLDDLLNDPKLKPMFEAFCAVGRRATIAEARTKADSIPNCRDVFVTETGQATEPVLGYLTNLDLMGVDHEDHS